MSGIAFGESARWHDGRLWFTDWVAGEVMSVDLEGRSRIEFKAPFPSIPMCIDFAEAGPLVVSTSEGLIYRLQADGALTVHADLKPVPSMNWNEILVDGRGNIYVNGGGTDPAAGGIIAVVTPGGPARQVAEAIAFPNGMAVTPDNATLIVAESYARRLTAFDITPDGGLSNRRVWADLGDGAPDGICVDADGAVWYADVPNKRCVRVREGGEVLQTVEAGRGCFSCVLGGPRGHTLFIVGQEWRGFEHMADGPRTGRVLTVDVEVPGVGFR
jgi:sugar lactone lactonase YvrE